MMRVFGVVGVGMDHCHGSSIKQIQNCLFIISALKGVFLKSEKRPLKSEDSEAGNGGSW